MVKVAKVTKRLGVASDLGERPYKTIESLKNFRDTRAYGKPLEIRTDVEVEATASHSKFERMSRSKLRSRNC